MKEREKDRLSTIIKVSHPTLARYSKTQWKLTKVLTT
jgi:hypothetical protein